MEKPLFFKTNSDGKIILTKIFLYNLKSSVPFYIIFDIKHDKNLIMVLTFLTFERKIMCFVLILRHRLSVTATLVACFHRGR